MKKKLFILFSFLIVLFFTTSPIFAQDSTDTLTLTTVENTKAKCKSKTECLNDIQACLDKYATLNKEKGVYTFQPDSVFPCINKALSTAPSAVDRETEVKNACKGKNDSYNCEVYLGRCSGPVTECMESWDRINQTADAFEKEKTQYAQSKCGNNLDCQKAVKKCYDNHHNNASALANCTSQYLPVITDDITANINATCNNKSDCNNTFRSCIESSIPKGQVITKPVYNACQAKAKDETTIPLTPIQNCQDNQVIHTPYVSCITARKCHFDTRKDGENCITQYTPESPYCVDATQTDLESASCIIAAPAPAPAQAPPAPAPIPATAPAGGQINKHGSVFYTSEDDVHKINPANCQGYMLKVNKEGSGCYPIILGHGPSDRKNRPSFPPQCIVDSLNVSITKDFCTAASDTNPLPIPQPVPVDQSLYINELSPNLIKCYGEPSCSSHMQSCYRETFYPDAIYDIFENGTQGNWRQKLDACVYDSLVDLERRTAESCGISSFIAINPCVAFTSSCMRHDGQSFDYCVKAWPKKQEQDPNAVFEVSRNKYVTESCGSDTNCRTGVTKCYNDFHSSAADLASCTLQYLPKISDDSQAQINSDCNNDQSCIASMQRCIYKTPGPNFSLSQYQACLTLAKHPPVGGLEEPEPSTVGKDRPTPATQQQEVKHKITVYKLLSYINQSAGVAVDQLITLTTKGGNGVSTSSTQSPAVFPNLIDGDYQITSSNPDSNLYNVGYFDCGTDCSFGKPSYTTSPPVVTVRNSDREITVIYIPKAPDDINQQLNACGNEESCRQKVQQCLTDFNLNRINQMELAQCGLKVVPQDLSIIDSDITYTCSGKDEACPKRIRECINNHNNPYLNKNDYIACLSLAQLTIVPPAQPVNTFPRSQQPPAGAPIELELSINGDTDPDLLKFTPSETVNLGARFYNNVYKPNDGCPSVTFPVGLTIKFGSNTTNIPTALYPCTPASYNLPKEPGEYTLSGYFPGEGVFKPSRSEINFTISNTPSLETKMIAHINGLKSFSTSIKDAVVNIGGRLFVDSPEKCLITRINLKLTKTADEKGTALNKVIRDGEFDNCTSYPVSLKEEGSGQYTLDASYSSDKIYFGSSDHATLTVLNTNTIPTVTEIKVGVNLTIKATTTPNGSSDTSGISIVNLVVNQVDKSGSSNIIYNQQVPNNQTVSMKISDLQNTDHFEVTADYFPDAGSLYEPSSAGIIIFNQAANAASKIKASPYVKLTTDPSNPSAIDNLTVIATTNQYIENPFFRVTKNNQNIDIDPSSITSANACQDGTGNCQYSFGLNELNGIYQISFCATDQLCDRLEFTTHSPQPSKDVSSIKLALNGESVDIPTNGNSLTLFLAGNNQQSNYQTIHFQVTYSDGQTIDTPLIIHYSNPVTDNQQPPVGQNSQPTPDNHQQPPADQQPQGECDDVNYWDENADSCIHKWSEEPYPNCSYTFDPIDNASCQ